VLERNPATGWQERWAARTGLTPDQFDRRLGPLWAAGSIGAVTLNEVEARTAALLELDQSQLQELMEDVWREYVGTLNDVLAGYFAALRPRYRTGILSNSFVGAREREQRAYGFEDLCDVVVYSHEEGVAKPDPAFYAIVCDRLGVQPTRAVFLDDQPRCVEGARRVGMAAIQYVDNDQAIRQLETVLATAGDGR
jgi:putative hydrolase of the HAD superfamily